MIKTGSMTLTATTANLNELFDALQSREIEMSDQLPTFGGTEPQDTQGVWSWDESRLIVGTCADDIQLVSRDEL